MFIAAWTSREDAQSLPARPFAGIAYLKIHYNSSTSESGAAFGLRYHHNNFNRTSLASQIAGGREGKISRVCLDTSGETIAHAV